VELARKASAIKHPDLVQILDMGTVDGRPYFVSEYVAGQSIAATIGQSGPLDPSKVLRIARHVAEALENAWRMYNLPHHDLKPENVMLDEDGTVKVVDLGLALLAQPDALAEQIRAGHLEADPHFMAPEQAQCDKEQNYRADIYSLGALMYFMLTGVRPFENEEPIMVLHHLVNGNIANPTDLVPSVPVGLSLLVGRMMMRDPTARPSDWGSVVHHVRRLEAGGAVLARPDSYTGSVVLPPAAVAAHGVEAAPAARAGRKPAKQAFRQPRALVPAWFRLPARLLLLAWLLLLSYVLFEPITLLLPRGPQRSAPAASRGDARTETHVTGEQAEPSHGQPAVEQTARPTERPSTQPELSDLRADVADAICAGNFFQALRLTEDELRMPHSAAAVSELNEIRDIVLAVSGINSAIAAGAQGSLRRDMPLHVRGREMTVELRAMAGEKLTGYVKTRRGLAVATNEITFSMSDLDPSDMAQFLGPAGTPGQCAMKYLVYMKARNHETARTFAENCGPLSAELIRQAESGRAFGE
jgi:hypothetical protein